MNLEELKIGDLVQVVKDDYIIQKGTICKVIGLIATDLSAFGGHKPVVSLLTIDTENIRSMSCENIEGIPLTKYILLKNGWKLLKHHERNSYDDVSWSSYHKPAETNISLVFYPEEEAFFLFLYAQEISETPIRYIHQLQHILFGLGLNHEMEV